VRWIAIAGAALAYAAPGNAQGWAEIRAAALRDASSTCSLGHAPTAFLDRLKVAHPMSGVQYALGDLDADATPGNAAAGK